MKDITIFSLDLNNHTKLPLQQLCISSWNRCSQYLKNQGINIKIKIFTTEDNEYIIFKKQFVDLLNRSDRLSHHADLFRIFMLANNKNWCWLDTDVYIFNFDKFNDLFNNYFFRSTFHCLYSNDNTEFFKTILDGYKNNPELIKLKDKDVCKFLNINNNLFENNNINFGFLHLSLIDNYYIHSKQPVPVYILNVNFSRDELAKELQLYDIKYLRKKRLILCDINYVINLDNNDVIRIPQDKYLLKFIHDYLNIDM